MTFFLPSSIEAGLFEQTSSVTSVDHDGALLHTDPDHGAVIVPLTRTPLLWYHLRTVRVSRLRYRQRVDVRQRAGTVVQLRRRHLMVPLRYLLHPTTMRMRPARGRRRRRVTFHSRVRQRRRLLLLRLIRVAREQLSRSTD